MLISKTIKKSLKYRNLGGKMILIEKEVPISEIFSLANEGNWACYNFLNRRPDIDRFYNKKIYYGHVDNLGYLITEDELK